MSAEVRAVRVTAGTRVGFWRDGRGDYRRAFDCRGFYTGPDLGDHLPGAKLEQPLMEGTLKFRVGVLFRPDLNKRQRLETVLLLENWIPEMFEYEDWDQEGIAAEA